MANATIFLNHMSGQDMEEYVLDVTKDSDLRELVAATNRLTDDMWSSKIQVEYSKAMLSHTMLMLHHNGQSDKIKEICLYNIRRLVEMGESGEYEKFFQRRWDMMASLKT